MTDLIEPQTWSGWPGIPPEPSTDLVLSLADEMRAALRSGAVGRMIVPPREVVEDAAGTKFVSMPAISPDYDLYINKTATIMAENAPGRAATVTSVVPIFSVTSGRLRGVLEGSAVTNLKCAAVTAMVTDRCAAADSRVLGIIGAGVQARQQFLGVSAVRDIEEVRVYSRDHGNAAAFARGVAEVAAGAGTRVSVRVCDSARAASEGVDVLATATTSVRPLPISTELPDHVHINCMGAHTVESRELPADVLRASVLIVEDRNTAIAEAGLLHHAAVELGVLETSGATGLPHQRTVFSSTGCAYLDLITCAHLVTV